MLLKNDENEIDFLIFKLILICKYKFKQLKFLYADELW